MARRKVPPKTVTTAFDSQEVKRDSVKKRLKIWIKRVVVSLIVICIVGIGIWVYEQWRSYVTPLSPSAVFAGAEWSAHAWDSKHQLVVGLWLRQKDTNVYRNAVLIVEPEVSMIDIVLLPPELSFKNVGELTSHVGLPIDRYIVQRSHQVLFDPDDISVSRNYIDSWHQDIQGFNRYTRLHEQSLFLKGETFTDLSSRELLSINALAQKISPGNIGIKNWPQDSIGIEKLRREVLVDSQIVTESLRIWVRNTTTISGLGGTMSSWAKNLGFEVVRVDNADCELLEGITCDGLQTMILTREEHINTWSIKRLEMLLGVKSVVTSAEDIKRADVIVLTGSDFGELTTW